MIPGSGPPGRITGFGACMIAGFPFGEESGFLQQTLRFLPDNGLPAPAIHIVSMGGFPAHRARKHLQNKVLAAHPEIVVLQFGSTDASAPLRNAFSKPHRSRTSSTSFSSMPGGRVSLRPPSASDRIKWLLRSLAAALLRVRPIVPREQYVEAVLGMAEDCRAAGARVVVISPFIMGSGRSNRFAASYTRALAQRLSGLPGVHFLDAHALLSGSPPAEMLLSDGFHLSRAGHLKLAQSLAALLLEIRPETAGRAAP